MADVLTFWDTHEGEHPSMVVCDKFIAAIEGTPYRGVFSAGIGPGTINAPTYGKVKVKHLDMHVTYKNACFNHPDKLIWVIVDYPDGTTFLHCPQLLEKAGRDTKYSLGEKMYEVTGWGDKCILENCHKEGFDKMYYRNHSDESRVIGPRTTCTRNWAVEFDGKNIIALTILFPKMSFGEIKNIILNEGGEIDSQGVIHKGTAENKVVEL